MLLVSGRKKAIHNVDEIDRMNGTEREQSDRSEFDSALTRPSFIARGTERKGGGIFHFILFSFVY